MKLDLSSLLELFSIAKADTQRKPMKIQTLIFSKDHFKSADAAKAWAKDHKFKSTGVDETGNSYRMRQESPGKFKKMRTITLTDGVKAVVGKAGITKGSPTSSDVHVRGPMPDFPAQHKQPVKLIKVDVIRPGKTAGQLHQDIVETHGNIGGTVRTGSSAGSDVDPLDGASDHGTTERFVFGPMVFDIDKARQMNGQEPNATVAVSPDWSHMINVDTEAAMESTSENPVMVAQIPTTNGIEQLLIDGHHRMHKAMHEGKESLAAHVFTPEETLELMDTTPGLMSEMTENLKKSAALVSTENPGDGKPIGKEMEQSREYIASKNPQEVNLDAAEAWKERAIAAFEQGDEQAAQSYLDEALEHSAMVKDEGKTVARVQRELEEAGLVLKDTEEGTQGDVTVNGFNNAGARSSGGMGDNVLAGLYDMQSIVDGMDWELEHETTEPDLAQEAAMANLQDDPLHYDKLRFYEDGIDWNSGWGLNGQTKGLKIDLGSGVNREAGHIGFDLEKHDHGTLVHDLNLGIPLPDESVKSVILRNSLAYMDCLSDDPKPLLSEIQRVLMPGGQFVYEGPNQIQNQPDWLKETWSEKFRHKGEGDVAKWVHPKPEGDDESGQEEDEIDKMIKAAFDDGEVKKIEGQPMFRQEFARVAVPDAATSNDSEPRIGVAQYDMLPADALLAMDALGYYWSDATSSGRGNRLHGYPSQGALVKELSEAALSQTFEDNPAPEEEITEAGPGRLSKEDTRGVVMGVRGRREVGKGGQGSGPQGGSAQPTTTHPGSASYDQQKNEKRQQMLAAQAAKDKERYERTKKSFGDKNIPIFKADPAKQIVYGVVLEPDSIDLQEDFMQPDEIEKTAHFFMMNGRTIGKNHETTCKAIPVESYIAPVDFELDGQYGNQTVKKGSWVLGVKVLDPAEWEKVVSGEYTGFSVGGWGQRSDPENKQW